MPTPERPSARRNDRDSSATADFYRDFFEEASDGMLIADQKQCPLAVNRQWLAMTGYSHDELPSIDLNTLIRPQGTLQEASLVAVSRHNHSSTCEQEFQHKDGRHLHFEISRRTLDNGNILCVARDITERKKAEAAAKERSRELAALQTLGLAVSSSLSLDQVGKAALHGILTAIQPDLAYLFLRDGERLLLQDIAPPEALPRLGTVPEHRVGECMCGLAVREEKALYSRNIHTDDRCTWDECKDAGIHSFATLPLRAGSMIIGVIGLASLTDRDFESQSGFLEIIAHQISLALANARNYQSVLREVTERKTAEEALQESEKKLRAIFERSPVGIILVDNHSTILDCNEHFAAIFGVERQRYLGIKLLDRLPVGPIHEYVLKTLTEKGIHRVEDSHTSIFSGKQVYLSIIGEKIHPDLFIFVMSDITEQKQAALAQEKLQERLLQSQKMESVGRLAGGIAHDFNNMLTAILGHTELALAHCSPQDAIRDDLKVIETAAHRSADLVRQLLAFARKQTITPKVLDLNDCVAGLLKMMVRLIGEDIDLVWKPGTEVWPVKIDPSQINQILANLCINARDAIVGVGKIIIATKNIVINGDHSILNPAITPGHYIQLQVSDNGLGIDKDVLEHIFEPFYTTKEVGKGTGLGLSTVYGIVKQNRGVINVYSEPDTGTTFKIYLPRFTDRDAAPKVIKKAEIPKGLGQLILLVEDEDVILNVGQVMLSRLGYTVLTAASPSEALRQAHSHAQEIKLLITDVIMPEMNGHDLAQLLVGQIPGLKCLFTSGYTSDIIVHHGVLDEKINFIQKPFSFMELAVKVREVMDQSPD